MAAPPDGLPSVVLVHGLRTSRAIWAAQLAHLGAAGVRAVAVDLPGHGARFDEPYTADAAQQVVADAVAAVPGPVVLVGLSLGGYTVLRYAAERPARVVAVVAAACTAEPRGRPVALYRDAASAVVTGWEGTAPARRAARAVLRPRRGRTPAPASDPDLARQPGWEVVTAALSGLAGRSSLATLAAVRVPVRLVNGVRDPMRVDERRHLAANPRARLTVIPGAGHDVSTDAPAAFDAELDDVIAQVLAEASSATGARLDP
ncbi:alpha-beta hydrolase superfamily lysophospholipase [Sediminihabitans luteus]|uniref:Alpha-beta hydrolase superfamily lysophospholipase n=1 Tax=Sediminihabitans luteus TaxID=1138585 RepID=A0A2M9CYU3_9CELL|nr:alpha/beta hydrolase [Sediminihabitans luteus]PJJ77112.1 alpha-beta hydrolase superfamily lysophospholipase [Sediminihabitans luteus]GIJ00368.1 lysophospholipase [Sediminihabitans luteus]